MCKSFAGPNTKIDPSINPFASQQLTTANTENVTVQQSQITESQQATGSKATVVDQGASL